MPLVETYEPRPLSVITGRDTLDSLYTLPHVPVFMGCVDSDAQDDLYADMEWSICRESGIIQLAKLLPLSILYQNQHNEGIGKLWQEHYLAFCEFLKKQSPRAVLEIGGAHAFIAEHFIERSPETSWTIVEPHPSFLGNEKIKVITGWFDDSFSCVEPVDTVVHSHVLEHMYDPTIFFQHISSFLKPGMKHVFTFPNMVAMLQQNYTNCLNFEHTIFLTERFVEHLLHRAGFRVCAKEYFRDHSIFYATEKVAVPIVEPLESQFHECRTLFMNFISYHTGLIAQLNERIAETKGPIYLFGAHVFSQYLMAFGLHMDRITAILDNSPTKQGKRLYGTNLLVQSPHVLHGQGSVPVILKAGAYNEEIKIDILTNINDQVIFW